MRTLTDRTVLRALRCPICRAEMAVRESGSLVCMGPRTHCFDFGASGYVNLSRPGQSGGGDSKQAVRARSQFLNLGHYRPVADGLCEMLGRYLPDKGALVLDAGCGEGYYSDRIADAGYATVGADLSKFAVDAAAKAARRERLEGGYDSRTLYAVGSVFELPVADASFDTLTNIFAPCAPAEYARVLRSGGHLLVAGAGERHLFGLKQLIYDDPYLNDPRRDLPAEGDGFTLLETRNVSFMVTVTDPAHREALFSMTPYYWRTSREGHDRLATADGLTTEVSFDLHVYKKH